MEFKRKKILVGNRGLLKSNKVSIKNLEGDIERLEKEGKTVLVVAIDGKAAGLLAVSDTIKEHSKEAIGTLRRNGLKVVMLQATRGKRQKP